jgi:hypothetical protein
MCGRVVRITPDSILALKYQVEKVFSGLTPSHNIAPNQGIVIINEEGVRQLIHNVNEDLFPSGQRSLFEV